MSSTFLIALGLMLMFDVGSSERKGNVGKYAFSIPTQAAEWASGDQPKLVPFCELTTYSRRYGGKTVRTEAIFVSGSEQSFLYDPRCNNLESLVSVEYESSIDSSTPAIRSLQGFLDRKAPQHDAGRARVMVVGRFEGRNGKRYGHLDRLLVQLRVSKVLQAKSVPDKTEWPRPIASPGSSWEDDEDVRNLNNELVFYLAGSPYQNISSEMLAEDFSYISIQNERADKLRFLGLRMSPFSGIIQNTNIRVYVDHVAARSTGVITNLRDGNIIDKRSYEIKFVRRANVWQALSLRLTRLSPQ